MKYTESHEWFSKETSRSGITESAQEQIGEIVHLELPPVGTTIEAGEEIAVIESTKAAADIYAPVSGVITKINEAVIENPSLINTDPEGEGWLYEVELSDSSQIQDLLSRKSYLSS